jgi:endonuclease/exonuclease/phosphatase family metal-dependent hydrolase
MSNRWVLSRGARTALDSLFVLAFFSLLSAFVESAYSFGLLGTDIPPEIVYVLFLLSPVLLVPFPRLLESRAFSLAAGGLGLLCWAASLPLAVRGRMLAAGLGCGLFLLFLPAWLRQSPRNGEGSAARLVLGILLSVFVRSLRSGNLFLSSGLTLVLGEALAVLTLILLVLVPSPGGAHPSEPGRRIGFGRTLWLTLGLAGCLGILYFAFTSPVVIARWGEASYALVLGIESAALILFLVFADRVARIGRGLLLLWNLLFLLALGFCLASREPAFARAAAYPLLAPEPGLPGAAAFWAMIVLHPVIFVDAGILAGSLTEGRPSPRALAGCFAIGALGLLILVFAQIFTTVYDYIPVIGPLFRDRFWPVVSAPAAAMALCAVLAGRSAEAPRRPSIWVSGAAAVLAAGALVVALATEARPAAAQATRTLRVLTWNIQQGYGKDGEKRLLQQLDVIRRMDPDIVGLQETDAARIAGGNSDLVRFLANELRMGSYYGPTPETGTFGIALLSRFPIRDPRTFFMASRGEQTAGIEADIAAGSRTFRVIVTHLDNDGAIAQQRVILERSRAAGPDVSPCIVLGDFNFDPSSEQYLLTVGSLDDAWLAAAQRTVDAGAPDPSGRIDHVFLGRQAGGSGTRATVRATRAEYLPEGPSDHPGLFVELEW